MKHIVIPAAAITIITLVVLLMLGGTKVLNMLQMDEIGSADSYHDATPYIYMIAGALMIFVAYFTYRLHFVAGMIPFFVGISAFFYGAYILSIKLGVLGAS